MNNEQTSKKPNRRISKTGRIIGSVTLAAGLTAGALTIDHSSKPKATSPLQEASQPVESNLGSTPGAPKEAPRQVQSWDLAKELKNPAGLYEAMQKGGFTVPKGGQFPAPEGISFDPKNPKDVEITVEDPRHIETEIVPGKMPEGITPGGVQVPGSANDQPSGPVSTQFEHDNNQGTVHNLS